MVVAASFGLSLGVSYEYLSYVDEANAMNYWIWLFASTSAISIILYLFGRKADSKLFKKEAICAVGLGWVFASLIGTLPYMLIGEMSFDDALFESTSGFTSTGGTVLDKVEIFPKSLLFWRAFTQWIGGLGIIVFFVALLSTLGSGAKTIYTRESKIDSTNFNGNLRVIIFKIFSMYAILSVLCASGLYVTGMTLYGAICTMLTTVSTGGFSVYNTGLANFGNSTKWVSILFMFIGGINFAVVALLFKGNFKKAFVNSEFKTYIAMLALISLAIFVYIANFGEYYTDIFDDFTDSVFHVVSTMTSTGFSNVDYEQWGALAHILLFFTMIIGGCAGSTSGGLKVVRALAALKISFNSVEKSFRPNIVRVVRLDGKALDDERAQEIMSFIVMYSIIAISGMILFSIFERDLSLETCISTIVSAISNIGPAFKETGPSQTYAFLTAPSKILISILMIMGRLEFYAILALFMPDLWRKFR